MTGRRGHCDVALHFPHTVTLGEFAELVEKLDDAGIYVNYDTLDFTKHGLYCEAESDIDGVLETIKTIKDICNGGVFIDWDTMYEWEPIEEGDE